MVGVQRNAVIVLAAALGAGVAGAQTTYHVNGGCGDDSWSGLSPVCAAPDGPKASIGAAMGSAQDGDTVLVADGVYTGASNKGLSHFGLDFTVRSENGPAACIIDCENEGGAFWFVVDESPASVVEGFTIRNGNGGVGGALFIHHAGSPTFRDCVFENNFSSNGGVALCENSSAPTFERCVFRKNAAVNGGAVLVTGGSLPTFIDCVFEANSAQNAGGAVFQSTFVSQSVRYINCLMAGNSAGIDGGGAFVRGQAEFINTTITGNTAGNAGGGLALRGLAVGSVVNGIVWGNSGAIGSQVALITDQQSGVATLSISYSDLEGGVGAVSVDPGSTLNAGPGLIDADPVFTDASGGDYLLAPGSAAIDAGDSTAVPAGVETDLDGNPRVVDAVNYDDTGVPDGMGRVVDMGPYEAAPDTPGAPCAGDLDGDGLTDTTDLNIVLSSFGCVGVPGSCAGDVDGDGDVDTTDLNVVLSDFGCVQ